MVPQDQYNFRVDPRELSPLHLARHAIM